MKTYRLFYLIIIIGLNSCAIHQGYFNTSTSIQSGNFRVIRPVSGNSSATYLLCIGGLSTDRLVFEAKEDLYLNADLKNNQALANIVVDNKYFLLFPIYITHKVYLSADIIEFSTNNDNQKFLSHDTLFIDKTSKIDKFPITINNSNNIDKSSDKADTIIIYTKDGQLIKTGSRVKFSDMFGIKYKGTVTKLKNKDSVEVEYDAGLGGYKTIVLKVKDIIKQ